MHDAAIPGETIVATATPGGRGGIAITRLSGPAVAEAAIAVLGDLPPERRAVLRRFRDERGEALDEGLALYFAAPHSYTGEPMLELHGHGSPVLQEALIARLLALDLGLRRARAGEFTLRAYLNGRLDLAQAEAVADLVAAGSTAAARAALRSLQGEFSRRVAGLAAELTRLRSHVEAAIDFADEDLDVATHERLHGALTALRAECRAVTAGARQGRLLRDGLVVVLAGRPNAGKSSLLNRLVGQDAAIVTAIPGTTRDLLRERIDLDGLPVELIDTAGLRDSAEPIEQEGVRRTREAARRADHILYLVDAADPAALAALAAELAALDAAPTRTVLFTKCDLASARPHATLPATQASLAISAQTGAGLDALRSHLREAAGFELADVGTCSARGRHLEALIRLDERLAAAEQAFDDGDYLELAAEELRLAQAELGTITGEFSSEDLLGEIFATFCIGK
jgi:tRNA modification GTPase